MKTRPHVKVHNGIRNHPRYASVFADPRLRGMVVGLWSVAADRFASRTNDEVTLTAGDLTWITGSATIGPALQALRSICERMGYELRTRGGERRAAGELTGELPGSWRGSCRVGAGGGDGGAAGPLTVVVNIRNFSRKQGFPERNPPPKDDRKTSQSTPSDSEYRIPNTETPPTPSSRAAETGARGVGSIDPGSGVGNGSGNGAHHEPTPDVATLGRVLELWCERFGQDRVEGEHDDGSLADDLDARIAEEPRLGEWIHLCDQVARQPFLAIGIGRDLGPVTLAWLVRDRDRIHRAKHMRYATERRAARA